MPWTKQQENAINARDTSIIVSAAAGSGKTAVLTERLVQLLADRDSGIRADRIVVVTFTNDAASELKKRLDMKLRALISNDPGNEHLMRQQTLLQSAKISTINSFCFELIRDNISEQGITSGFAVLDDTDDTVLKAQAMDDLFDWYSENDYDTISYLYDRFCIKNEDSLKEVIRKTDNFLASVTFADKWIENACAEYNKELYESCYYSLYIKNCIKKLQRAYKLAQDNIDILGDIFTDIDGIPAAKKTYDQALEEKDAIYNYLRIFKNGSLPTDDDNIVFGRRPAIKKTVEHNAALLEVFAARRDMIKKMIGSVASSYTTTESDFAESGKVTEYLSRMLKKYREIVWERKCEKNALSFDDGERMALELLADTSHDGSIVQSETARQISEYYDIIMIDEYQDSNNKQDLIFKLLSKNYRIEDGIPRYGDNVFLVGDVKQSIYGFRLANPRNFISTLNSSVPYDEGSSSRNQSIILNKNFRSSPEVIDFINYIFEKIMSEKCGDINYDDNEKLYFGAEEYSQADEARKATFLFITENDEDDQDERCENPEVVCTAEKIVSMLNSGTEVIMNDGRRRPCQPSDFCILTRSNAVTNEFASALIKRGIEAKGSEEKGYLDSREIAILIDLLRIISNPLLDIPMAAVMTSPMYAFSIPELAYIKSFDNNCPLFILLRDITAGKYESFDDMFLMQRCIDFLESIDRFRLDSVTLTIGELISSIYDTTDFISVMQLYSDGEKKRANLRALIQYAQGYEEYASFEGSGGLGGFLRHIDRITETGDYAQGRVSATAGNYVTIQTMHSSKGLEYPFVFIAQTNYEFKSDSETVMCSDNGRIGYILYDPEIVRRYKTFQQILLAEEKMQQNRSEEMRLLYVGMTRAKQKLFINMDCGKKTHQRVESQISECIMNNGDITPLVANARTYSDWLWACIIKHKYFSEIAEKTGITGAQFGLPHHDTEEDLFRCEYFSISDYTVFDSIEDNTEAEADPAVCQELTDLINADYDRELSELPAKLSVTQVSRKFSNEEEFDFRLQRPRFISGTSKKLTGAERGTAIHTFFQYCDFENAIKDTGAEILNMVKAGHITVTEGESINIENVRAFFENDIYKRIISARSYWRERKFMAAISQLDIEAPLMEKLKKSDGMIKGIIDLMFEEDGGIVILDYKSDRGVSTETLRSRYTPQIQLYRAAVELTTGCKVKSAYLYSFELHRTIEVPLR